MTWEKHFSQDGEYYPGNSKRMGQPPSEVTAEDADASWDSNPRIYAVDGIDFEFFSIGDLALALNRKAVTVRLWERRGFIPVTNLRSPSAHESKRHRIYTRALVEGIVRIAEEEGILHEARPRIKETQFQKKNLALFMELSKKHLYGAVPVNETT